MKPPCIVEDCNSPRNSLVGYCKKHYWRVKRQGTPADGPWTHGRPAADKLWARVQKTDSCWLWTGAVSPDGYGHIYLSTDGGGSKFSLTHRLAYELLVGPIPDGLTIDHLCRVRRCCNPEHLEPVTAEENVIRAYAVKNGRRSDDRFCLAGHDLTDPTHQGWWADRKNPVCKTCDTKRKAERKAARRAVA